MIRLDSGRIGGTRSASKYTVTNRFETFRCHACGRGVKRKSRQQRFCSDRCRDFARRERDASQINARTAIKNVVGYQDSGQPTHPFYLSNKVNGLQGQKSGSSIPLNVLGGFRWPNAVGVDRELLRKIVMAEIGDTR
jgi:predicted nucleic acid-binding Zn ribbon protein